MGKFLWILGGTTLGLAIYVVLKDPSSPMFSTAGRPDLADDVTAWGTKQRAVGTGGQLKGKLEQFGADLTGNPDLGDKGVFDEAKGAVKDAAGQAAQALANAARSLDT